MSAPAEKEQAPRSEALQEVSRPAAKETAAQPLPTAKQDRPASIEPDKEKAAKEGKLPFEEAAKAAGIDLSGMDDADKESK